MIVLNNKKIKNSILNDFNKVELSFKIIKIVDITDKNFEKYIKEKINELKINEIIFIIKNSVNDIFNYYTSVNNELSTIVNLNYKSKDLKKVTIQAKPEIIEGKFKTLKKLAKSIVDPSFRESSESRSKKIIRHEKNLPGSKSGNLNHDEFSVIQGSQKYIEDFDMMNDDNNLNDENLYFSENSKSNQFQSKSKSKSNKLIDLDKALNLDEDKNKSFIDQNFKKISLNKIEREKKIRLDKYILEKENVNDDEKNILNSTTADIVSKNINENKENNIMDKLFDQTFINTSLLMNEFNRNEIKNIHEKTFNFKNYEFTNEKLRKIEIIRNKESFKNSSNKIEFSSKQFTEQKKNNLERNNIEFDDFDDLNVSHNLDLPMINETNEPFETENIFTNQLNTPFDVKEEEENKKNFDNELNDTDQFIEKFKIYKKDKKLKNKKNIKFGDMYKNFNNYSVEFFFFNLLNIMKWGLIELDQDETNFSEITIKINN